MSEHRIHESVDIKATHRLSPKKQLNEAAKVKILIATVHTLLLLHDYDCLGNKYFAASGK